MRKFLPTLLGLAVLAAAFVGLSRLIEARTERAMVDLGESEAARPLAVDVARLEYQDGFRAERRYTGIVRARRRSELTFEGTGRVTEILVQEGQAVPAGAPLARLDTRILEAQRAEVESRRIRLEAQLAELVAGPRDEVVDAARADLAALEEELALARQLLERRTALAERGSVSDEQLDTSRGRTRTLEARLEGARARLTELENGSRPEALDAQRGALAELDAALAAIDVRIDRATLVAPFGGTVEARLLDEGAVVSQQMPRTAFVLSETGALEARVGVPGDMVEAVTGAPGEAQLRFRGATLPATAARALPVVEAGTRTVTVVLDLEPAGADAAAVRPGDLVTLEVQRAQPERGAWLPMGALSESQRGLWSAFVLDVDGERTLARRAELEVLHVEAERAYVRGTVADGAEVVVSGAHRLTDGQAVSRAPADRGE